MLFFGRLTGLRAMAPEVPISVFAFRRQLEAEHPELAKPGINMAVNQELVRDDLVVGPDDEIAFLPPMSGG